MSEGSRPSRVTITSGRGQVVNRAGSESYDGYDLPRVGTKRPVKERLGKQLNSSVYGSEDVVNKRQRGEASFSGNDLQISQNDLRLKLRQKSAQRRAQSDECSTMDLREKLSRSEQPARSTDTRPLMAEPRDVPLSSSRTALGSSQMISSGSMYSPRHRSPERFVDTSRGLSPSRNPRRVIGIQNAVSPSRVPGRILSTPRDLSPPGNTRRSIGTARGLSPPGNTRRSIGTARGLSPPRKDGRIIDTPRDRSPPGNTGRRFVTPRDRSPPGNIGRRFVTPRDRSPPGNTGRRFVTPRDRSPPGNTGRRFVTPRDLSPPKSYTSFSNGSRALSPTRYMGSNMGSPRCYSPPRNPGSYAVSSRGSPPRSNIEDFHGRGRMVDDLRMPRYVLRGVVNDQAQASEASFTRPMSLPRVPNPHQLPSSSQLPPPGSMMWGHPFSVLQQVGGPPSVDSFLESIGLGRYHLAFKKEEVDMNTIKQMKESDLKDLNIPMGPRKRILQAIASLPTQ